MLQLSCILSTLIDKSQSLLDAAVDVGVGVGVGVDFGVGVDVGFGVDVVFDVGVYVGARVTMVLGVG